MEKPPKSFYEASISLIPEPNKDNTRKLQATISNEYRYKNPQQNISKLNFDIALKGPYTMIK